MLCIYTWPRACSRHVSLTQRHGKLHLLNKCNLSVYLRGATYIYVGGYVRTYTHTITYMYIPVHTYIHTYNMHFHACMHTHTKRISTGYLHPNPSPCLPICLQSICIRVGPTPRSYPDCHIPQSLRVKPPMPDWFDGIHSIMSQRLKQVSNQLDGKL